MLPRPMTSITSYLPSFVGGAWLALVVNLSPGVELGMQSVGSSNPVSLTTAGSMLVLIGAYLPEDSSCVRAVVCSVLWPRMLRRSAARELRPLAAARLTRDINVNLQLLARIKRTLARDVVPLT